MSNYHSSGTFSFMDPTNTHTANCLLARDNQITLILGQLRAR